MYCINSLNDKIIITLLTINTYLVLNTSVEIDSSNTKLELIKEIKYSYSILINYRLAETTFVGN